MSEVFSFSKDEWEAFLKDSEELIGRYTALLKKVSELEESKKELERRVQILEEELRRVEEARRILEVEKERELRYSRENLHQIHSEVSRLLQTEAPGPGPSEAASPPVRESAASPEAEAQEEPKSIEEVIQARRDAVRKLLSEGEEA